MSFEANDNSDDVMSEINMTPLVDVMLVLLVIFIITLPVIHHVVKVDLPSASSTRNTPAPKNLQLSIDAQGQYFLGKQALDANGLLTQLQAEASKDPQPQLYIRGDKRVPYEFVAQAMSSAKRAGMQRVGFVTTQP
jgi:biopolymer transport protein ExbD